MGAKLSESRIYQVPTQYIVNELRSMQFCQLQGFQFLSMNPNGNSVSFWYRHGMSMNSWGERICIVVTTIYPYSTQITIHSECEYGPNYGDWTQNRNNILSIYSHLERYAINAARTPVQAAVCPHCRNPITPGTQFCQFCGNALF